MTHLRPTTALGSALVALALAVVAGHAATLDPRPPFEARVLRVVDGDTLEVVGPAGKERIRLAQIDAPESDQPHGAVATRALSALVLHRDVRVEPVVTDRYGRLVAEVFVGSLHVNPRLVRDGHSWVYQRYAVDEALNDLERDAKDHRRGLWSRPEAERLPPWVWRASRRARTSDRPGKAMPELPEECSRRRYCREMTSCEEAIFYFRECRFDYLDGDRDGVPCESVCKQPAGEEEG